MKKTKRLLTAVTTSVLLNAAGAPPPAFTAPAPAPVQTGKLEDESWKRDPEVKQAADKILKWLKGTYSFDGKTQKDVQNQFPTLSPVLIGKALRRLVEYQGNLKRRGSGTEADPYIYYELVAAGG